jgi:hypothetical protein
MTDLKARQKQVAAIIDELGGTTYVARFVSVVPSAVSNWRKNGRFPARTYLQLTRELKTKKAPIPSYLWGMEGR